MLIQHRLCMHVLIGLLRTLPSQSSVSFCSSCLVCLAHLVHTDLLTALLTYCSICLLLCLVYDSPGDGADALVLATPATLPLIILLLNTPRPSQSLPWTAVRIKPKDAVLTILFAALTVVPSLPRFPGWIRIYQSLSISVLMLHTPLLPTRSLFIST